MCFLFREHNHGQRVDKRRASESRTKRTITVENPFHSSPAALALRSSLAQFPSLHPSKPNSVAIRVLNLSFQVQVLTRRLRIPAEKRSYPMNRMHGMHRVRLLALLFSVLLMAGFSSAQTATGETLMLNLPRQSQHASNT